MKTNKRLLKSSWRNCAQSDVPRILGRGEPQLKLDKSLINETGPDEPVLNASERRLIKNLARPFERYRAATNRGPVGRLMRKCSPERVMHIEEKVTARQLGSFPGESDGRAPSCSGMEKLGHNRRRSQATSLRTECSRSCPRLPERTGGADGTCLPAIGRDPVPAGPAIAIKLLDQIDAVLLVVLVPGHAQSHIVGVVVETEARDVVRIGPGGSDSRMK